MFRFVELPCFDLGLTVSMHQSVMILLALCTCVCVSVCLCVCVSVCLCLFCLCISYQIVGDILCYDSIRNKLCTVFSALVKKANDK